MTRLVFPIRFLLAGVSFFAGTALCAAEPPSLIYLTWQGDTGKTMTVNYLTNRETEASQVYYDTRSRKGNPLEYRFSTLGAEHVIPGLEAGPFVHWVELKKLKPGETYYFVAGDSEGGFSLERKFRTIPNDGSALRFVTGGDMGEGESVRILNRHAAALEPRFALIGGDIAYANGSIRNLDRWKEWLHQWVEEMVTPEGYTVPLSLAIGNHEVQSRYGGKRADAPFYFGLFAQAGQSSFFRRQYGPRLAIYFLDSGHIASHESQTAWLENQLRKDRRLPYRFAIYHVPLYPSHRAYEGKLSELGRRYWAPLFDKYELTAAFENHDHTFKRSKILLGNEVSKEGKGVLYLGDGAWGREPRTIPMKNRWYLSKVSSSKHFWAVEVGEEGVIYRAYDIKGKIFDVYPSTGEEAKKAKDYFSGLKQNYRIEEGSLSIRPLLIENRFFNHDTVEVTWFNQEPYPVDVSLHLETADPMRVKPPEGGLTLLSGEKKTFPFSLGSTISQTPDKLPLSKLIYSLTYHLPAKTIREEGFAVIAVEGLGKAIRLPSPVQVDGDLSDWESLPYGLEKAGGFFPGERNNQWRGRLDASCRFGIGYDDEFLYVGLEIWDDTLSLPPNSAPWEEDGILIWADIFPGGEGDDDAMFGISPGMGQANRHYADNENTPPGTRAAGIATQLGYNVELALPMAYFKALRRERGGGVLQYVRLNFGISDQDKAEEKPVTLLWRPAWHRARDYTWSGVFKLGE